MPRYGPAVLRALAAYDEARRAVIAGPWMDHADAYAAACIALSDALDADAPAVPVLPDESERAAQPHRFGGIL